MFTLVWRCNLFKPSFVYLANPFEILIFFLGPAVGYGQGKLREQQKACWSVEVVRV